MDLRRLKYFLVLAEELHFNHAAERLHITQPGLSQQIRVFERELKVTLFERTTAGVTLTDAGRVLQEEGVGLLSEADRIATRVTAAAEGRTGTLRVLHSRSLTTGLPDDLVRTFGDHHPDADIVVEVAWTTRNIAMIRAGEADVGFVRLPLAEVDDLDVVPLGSTELVVAIPVNDPLTRRRALRFEDLQDKDLVSWPREQAPGYFDHIQSTVWQRPPRVAAVEPDPERLIAAVEQGLGVCVIDAQRAARLKTRGVVLRRFARPGLSGDFGIVWSPHRVSALLAAFLAHCRQARP